MLPVTTGAVPLHLTTIEAVAAVRSRRVRAWVNTLQYVLDIVMLVLAFVLGYWARTALPLFSIPNSQPDFLRYAPTLILQVATTVTLLYFTRMYHQPRAVSRIDQARNIVGVVAMAGLMVMGIQEVLLKNGPFDPVDYPRSMFFYVLVFSILLMLVGREAFRALRRALRVRGLERDNLLIVGMGKVARTIAGKIKNSPELGYTIVGIVNVRPKKNEERILGIPVIGDYQQIPTLIDRYAVDQVIIALPDAQRHELAELVTLSQRGRVDIKIYPDMFAYIAHEMSVDELGDMPLLTVRDIALRGWKLSLKRGLDVFGSTVGLILLSPLILLTALLIRLESPGQIFYTQQRMGLDGRPFDMIKFRSMRMDAEASGPGWTKANDSRVTRIGRFIRKTNWDEIPQLINVFIGEMSLVGPRPERPVYVHQFRESIPRYMERHREKAGMTGWAQVNGLRGDTSIAERTSYDLWYVENWSLWLDVKIILRTVIQSVLRRSPNAY